MSSNRPTAVPSPRQGGRGNSDLKEMFRVLLHRCGDEALLVHDGHRELVRALRKSGADWTQRRSRDLKTATGTTFRSVVLFEVLHALPAEKRRRALRRAWNLVGVGGKLYVVSPQTDPQGHSPPGRLSPRALRRLLGKVGRPRLLTEQPYRWILMTVQRVDPVRVSVDRMVRRRLAVTRNLCRGEVVELGCGRGFLPRMLHARGLPVIGLDLNPDKLRAAREHFPQGNFVRGDILALPLSARTFDTVLLPEVLEHVPEEVGERMLAGAWELVRPGGRLVVSVPNEDCIPHPNHVRTFSRGTLRRTLAPFGRPRLVTDQPYKWLMMYVDKEPGKSGVGA
jgi:SAM-dependent methyltransferase